MDRTLEQTLQDTERRRLRALVEGDVQLARSLHADDYQLVTPGGACESKETYLGAIAEGGLDYEHRDGRWQVVWSQATRIRSWI